MKILCLTESLGSGGAERQLCNLAVGLKKAGNDVSFLTYAKGDFYSHLLENAGIKHIYIETTSKLNRFLRLRKYIRTGNQDVILSFLKSSSIWTILASVPNRRWGLIVSERSALPDGIRSKWHTKLYEYADAITTNSHTNRKYLEQDNPKLSSKINTIYNSVNLEYFKPEINLKEEKKVFSFIVAATYIAKKNMVGLIKAVRLIKKNKPELNIIVNWYGSIPQQNTKDYDLSKEMIAEYGLENCFKLNQTIRDIRKAYYNSDAVILPSFYEGLPNTVCEAMACGKPVLMSDVCDARNLVGQGENGFLFNPYDSNSIAETIIIFCNLESKEREQLGKNSRLKAEAMFDYELTVRQYLEVINTAYKKYISLDGR